MTPADFITKWRAAELKESSAAQEHFVDLCHLLGEPTPADVDPRGDWYAFERGATKTTGGEGWADVWKRGHFGWEYKGKRKDLTAAFVQLQQYALALENPPLLVVSDIERIEIHTNWTNSISTVDTIVLDDLRDGAVRDRLKAVLSDPEKLRPGKTRESLTLDAAGEFAELARLLREQKHDPQQVAHFINRLVFCMFAEDIGLLPGQMFSKMLEHAKGRPEDFPSMAQSLFAAMKSGGRVGFEKVDWFNGGLFDDDRALPLDRAAIETTIRAARLDWSEIDPSIFGTLFERGLDPDKRSQLGAHYTDREKIMMIVEPVVIRPWLAEWESAKPDIVEARAKAEQAATPAARTRAKAAAVTLYRTFLDRLRAFTILDPACGSGNFLYLGLRALKDLEHRVMIEAEALGFEREFPEIGPRNVKGIEINPFAAELARVTVWIGEIQWMRKNGFPASHDPILKPLDTIECRDALLNPDGSEASWPKADVIIGNPPFLGAKLMYRRLGRPETLRLRSAFAGRLPGFTDLVCYWFEKARAAIAADNTKRAGLVATNSIRKNTNLPVLQRIKDTTEIFEAWSEEQWVVDGAAVDVSLVCFGAPIQETRLDGVPVSSINPDLTTGLNLTLARPLRENRSAAFLGIQKSGPFDIPGDTARAWLLEPTNPNGRQNAEVLRPYWNGDDVTGRPRDRWFIDLPLGLSEAEASLFVSPFAHIASTPDDDGKTVRELRSALAERGGPRWWEPAWPRPEMRTRIKSLSRYIVTPETAQHRLFVWMRPPLLPDKNLIVVPREDDLMFGLLQNRFHGAWALRRGSDLEDRPRYTHTSTFASFPFPHGLTPDIPAADYSADPRAVRIADAARRLNELRERWLNPPELVRREPEVVPGYPDRLIPIIDRAKKLLAKRTLTKLYNERPAWLDNIHRELDAAVAAAYGWPEDITDEDALGRLLALNQERSAART